MAHVTCGGCATTLMYPYGAQSVKCAVCQFVTAIGVCLLHLLVLSIWHQYFVHDDIWGFVWLKKRKQSMLHHIFAAIKTSSNKFHLSFLSSGCIMMTFVKIVHLDFLVNEISCSTSSINCHSYKIIWAFSYFLNPSKRFTYGLCDIFYLLPMFYSILGLFFHAYFHLFYAYVIFFSLFCFCSIGKFKFVACSHKDICWLCKFLSNVKHHESHWTKTSFNIHYRFHGLQCVQIITAEKS